MLIVDGPNLERLPGWVVRRGLNINAVDVSDFIAQELPGGPLEEYIVAPPYGGALATLPRPVPIVDGKPLPYLEHSFQVKMSAAALAFDRNVEADVIPCWPAPPNAQTSIQQKANGSCQRAIYRGGMWQFSGSNPWTDTGFAPGIPAPDTWDPAVIRYSIDWTFLTITPIYIASMGQTCTTFPLIMQKMPFLTSNWTRGLPAVPVSGNGVIPIQYQLDNNGVAAAFEVEFQGVMLRWSDNVNF